jgi:hypothetical protein
MIADNRRWAGWREDRWQHRRGLERKNQFLPSEERMDVAADYHPAASSEWSPLRGRCRATPNFYSGRTVQD